MLTLALIAAALAALVHGYIFVLESLLWTTPRARATFDVTSDDEARHTKPLAFNQGFYNLFLGLVAAIGVVLTLAGASAVGITLIVVATGSMLGAALVLTLSMPALRRAALVQGLLPLIALVALGVTAL